MLFDNQNINLLMKNYESHPTRYALFPEVNVTIYNYEPNRGHACSRTRDCGHGRDCGRDRYYFRDYQPYYIKGDRMPKEHLMTKREKAGET